MNYRLLAEVTESAVVVGDETAAVVPSGDAGSRISMLIMIVSAVLFIGFVVNVVRFVRAVAKDQDKSSSYKGMKKFGIGLVAFWVIFFIVVLVAAKIMG